MDFSHEREKLFCEILHPFRRRKQAINCNLTQHAQRKKRGEKRGLTHLFPVKYSITCNMLLQNEQMEGKKNAF